MEIDQLQHDIRYRFRNLDLLLEALTHPSLAYENPSDMADNQRLEFLEMLFFNLF